MNSITLYLKKTKIDIKKLLKEPLLLSVITLIGISLFLFVILPLYKIFQISLVEDGNFTLATFWKLLSKSYNRRPLFNSLKLGLSQSLLGNPLFDVMIST